MICLHDPHARLKEPNCRSSQKILHAARAILDQVFAITSTSLDLTYVDHLCSVCCFIEAKVICAELMSIASCQFFFNDV